MPAQHLQVIEKNRNEIIDYRRSFHQFPEVGWTEFRTASLIAKKLSELDFNVQLGKEVLRDESRMGLPSDEELDFHYQRALRQGADPEFVKQLKGGFTGVVGTMEFGTGVGPVVAFRFDIDALKIAECTSGDHAPMKEGFASANENVMHACGHDGHAAMGLGLALALAACRDRIEGSGKIKLIFQPAEEGVRGAKAMVDAGVLDDVDFILGGHLMPDRPSGTLIAGSNGFLATTKFDVLFKGVAAHAGGAPNEGKNSMLAACTAVLNMNAIPRHKDGATRINVGRMVSGTDRNVIAAETLIQVETRGVTSEINTYVESYALRIIENSAKMHDVSFEVKYMGAALSGSCSVDLVRRVRTIGQELGCFPFIEESTGALGGSEDYTYMMNKVQQSGGQGTFLLIGTGPHQGAHTARYDMNEDDLIKGVKLYTTAALSLLTDESPGE